MEPLDLTQSPPRSAKAEAGGIIFLPRTIDKARASLPGGNLGAYHLNAFSARMFETFGVSHDAFIAAVAAAQDDAAIVALMMQSSTAEARAAWHAFITNVRPRNGDRAEALTVFPWLHDRDEVPLALDVLDEDDRRLFAAT